MIQVDSRERKFGHIKDHFDKVGVKWFVSKLVVGDYAFFQNPTLVIDRKQSLLEVHSNICQGHARFKRELLRANDLGITLLFLVEQGGHIRTLSDVRHWHNPRLSVSPYALNGYEMYRRLLTIQAKYNTQFLFCDPSQTGEQILEILNNPDKYTNNGGTNYGNQN